MKKMKKLLSILIINVSLILCGVLYCFATNGGGASSGGVVVGSTWVPQGQAYIGGCRVTIIDASGNIKKVVDVYSTKGKSYIGSSTLTLLSSEDIQWQIAHKGDVINGVKDVDYKDCMYRYPQQVCNVDWGSNDRIISDKAPLFPGHYTLEIQCDPAEANTQRKTLSEWAIENKDFSSDYLALLQQIDSSITKDWLTTGVSVGGEETRPVVFFQPLLLMTKASDYGRVDPFTSAIVPGEISPNTNDDTHDFIGTPTLHVITDADYHIDDSYRPILYDKGKPQGKVDFEVTSGQIVTPMSGNNDHIQKMIDKYVATGIIKSYNLNNKGEYAGLGIVTGWPGDDSSGGGGSGGGGGVPSNKADIIIKSQNVILYEDELSYVYSNVKFSIVKQNKNINIVKKC